MRQYLIDWGFVVVIGISSTLAACGQFAIADAFADQPTVSSGKALTPNVVHSALQSACAYFHQNVASHGGYVYHYSLDLSQRWGEGVATKDQIWVQPPGTPTVGLAFLRAYQATGDQFFLNAAQDAAEALVAGQLKSGGWTNCIDFAPNGERVADYRNRRGRGRNYSSLDDGQTQTAMIFLMRFDEATHFQNKKVHEASKIALEALLAAQFANGAFPQVWSGPINKGRNQPATFPEQDAQSAVRIKNYWDMATLNDNVAGYVADVLIEADRVYKGAIYLKRLKRLGNFLLLAQMPPPQSGWAQQYDDDMRPTWARRFEPPAIGSDETMEVIETLMKITEATGDKSFLKPIPDAARWLGRSRLPDGNFARFYELKTNRPLYMKRQGKQYSLTYDDSDLPDHYGWKIGDKTAKLGRMYRRVQAGLPVEEQSGGQSKLDEKATRAKTVVEQLDNQGRWVSTFDGKRLVGQPKFADQTQYLSCEVFSKNVSILCDYLESTK